MTTPASFNHLKDALDAAFKYKVGDLVQLRSVHVMMAQHDEINNPLVEHQDAYNLRGEASVHAPVIILARVLEECHGGVQAFYRIRNFKVGEDHTHATNLVHEYELVSYEDYVNTRKSGLAPIAAKHAAAAERTRR